MELLTKAGSIKVAIEKLRPTHIATAYVGLGWETYIDKETLQSIVLSPTFGSNALAIRELVRQLGIDNVHFLDNLHAKFYLTKQAAVLGSANLSDNGMQGSGGLIEAAVLINEVSQLRKLTLMHADLVATAKSKYRTSDQKYQRINALELINQKASRDRLVRSKHNVSNAGVPLEEFDQRMKRRIHIIPHSDDLEVREEIIKAAIPGKSRTVYEELFENVIGFLPKDDIQEGDWLLCFESEKDAPHPKKSGAIEWMYVDYVVPNGSSSTPYTKVALQSRERKHWEAPFVLSKNVKVALRTVAIEPKYKPLYDVNVKRWNLRDADALVPDFLRELQRAVAMLGRKRTSNRSS